MALTHSDHVSIKPQSIDISPSPKANMLRKHDLFNVFSKCVVVFGFLVFHDIPDYWTLTGIALIVGAGLYVFGRNTPAAKLEQIPFSWHSRND